MQNATVESREDATSRKFLPGENGWPILAESKGTYPSPPELSDEQEITQPIFAENRATFTKVDDLLETVTAFDRQFSRLNVAGNVRVQDHVLSVGDSSVSLDEEGISRLCSGLGIPTPYVSTLPEPLRSGLLQHHLDARDFLPTSIRASGAVSVVAREGKFIGFSRGDLVHVDLPEVITAVADECDRKGLNLKVHRADLDNSLCQIELVSPETTNEPSPGDVLMGGVALSFSPVGDRATTIETFLYRLICRNGMVHRVCVENRALTRTRRLPVSHPEARSLQVRQLHDLTSGVVDKLQAHLADVSALREEHLEDPSQFLAQMLRHARLWSRTTADRLHAAWRVEGAEPTAYGVFNALTRVASHDQEFGQRLRRSLSALAGLLSHRRTHICPRCYSVVGQ